MSSPTTSDTTFSNAITLISIFIILLASCLLIKCLCTQSPIVLRSLFNFLYKDYLQLFVESVNVFNFAMESILSENIQRSYYKKLKQRLQTPIKLGSHLNIKYPLHQKILLATKLIFLQDLTGHIKNFSYYTVISLIKQKVAYLQLHQLFLLIMTRSRLKLNI